MPSFYGKPQTLNDAIDTVVSRILDHAGVAHTNGRRWGEP
jgi:4-hydroxy-3-polyprenylbenzoate decarboxylase